MMNQLKKAQKPRRYLLEAWMRSHPRAQSAPQRLSRTIPFDAPQKLKACSAT
ncbi:hypothetical protein [Trichocoleus sp. DQ-A2]|uniref:hypothetical protein n=1 Tax=Trichocoleus sp. DQ-A2 TaxID=2933924 RepID=UPI003298A3AE